MVSNDFPWKIKGFCKGQVAKFSSRFSLGEKILPEDLIKQLVVSGVFYLSVFLTPSLFLPEVSRQ